MTVSRSGWMLRRTSGRDAFVSPEPGLDGWVLVGPTGVVASRIEAAVTPLRRVRGLLGRDRFDRGEALLLAPCRQIHTFGMRFAIDAVFCDAELGVLAVRTLRPRRVSPIVRRARACFELPAGVAEAGGIRPGTALRFERRVDRASPSA